MPERRERTCFNGIYNSLVPSIIYIVLLFDKKYNYLLFGIIKNSTLSPKRIQYHSHCEVLIFFGTTHCSITIPASLPRDAPTFLMQVVTSPSNDSSMQGTFSSYTNSYNFQVWTQTSKPKAEQSVIYASVLSALWYIESFLSIFMRLSLCSFTVDFISSYSEMFNREVRLYLNSLMKAWMTNVNLAE